MEAAAEQKYVYLKETSFSLTQLCYAKTADGVLHLVFSFVTPDQGWMEPSGIIKAVEDKMSFAQMESTRKLHHQTAPEYMSSEIIFSFETQSKDAAKEVFIQDVL